MIEKMISQNNKKEKKKVHRKLLICFWKPNEMAMAN